MSEAKETMDSVAAAMEGLLGKVPEAGTAIVQGCAGLFDQLSQALDLLFSLRLVEAQSVLLSALSACHTALVAQLAQLWPG